MKFNNLYTDKILNDNNNDDMVVCIYIHIWKNSILIDSVNGCEGKWWIYKNERINKQWLYVWYFIYDIIVFDI